MSWWHDLFVWGYATGIDEDDEEVTINITIEFEDEEENT